MKSTVALSFSVLIFSLSSPSLEAEQLTWSFSGYVPQSNFTFRDPEGGTGQVTYQASGRSDVRTTPIFTQELVRDSFWFEDQLQGDWDRFRNSNRPYLYHDYELTSGSNRFHPISTELLSQSGDYEYVNRRLFPGTLTLTHPESGDQERWAFEAELMSYGWGSVQLSFLEGDRRLGPYPYTLYALEHDGADTPQSWYFLSSQDGPELGVAFFVDENGSPVRETPEPCSLLLAVLGVTGLGAGGWYQKLTRRTNPLDS